MRRLSALALAVGLTAALAAPARAASLPPLTLAPQAVAINSLYNGTDLTVTGDVPAGSQVVVRLAGEPETFRMKQKARVLGVLWMNTEKVAFAGAPSVFLVAASPEAAAAVVSGLGVPGLARTITVESNDPDKAALLAEFLKFQQAEQLYLENAGQVTLGPDAGDTRPFTAVLRLPSRLSPGAYAVEVLALDNGAVAARGQATMTASFVGAPAFLADMAFGHGALYGILASIIAILGGLVIGQLFSGSKSGAH
ncbi:TIGR02186 family protein [Solidesulfovibrio sp.]|uniref:TIGR02186 family protein n=1 Tax=Solidesulfovibrio sp. TaxID=2910990 RepID=UPI002B21FAE0|nr:TIGR02186 family protein [Solidesulfovibrio sp.]MEA4857603.1 TIGR02186 family protein [Solidesulfovibrio sp.]